MKIVTAAEMREIDRLTSKRFGVPSLTLMENAGAAVADHVLSNDPAAQRIAVICGKGNNGGDGFVAARLLHEKGKAVDVILLADPAELKGDAAAMYGKLPVPATIVRTAEELKKVASLPADLYLDAILGTGFKPPVSGLYADAIGVLNASSAPVCAVDIPSGADADAMGPQPEGAMIARADSIVTFTAPRPAHLFSKLTKGPTIVAPIGSPEEAIVSSLNLSVLTPSWVAPLLEPRQPDSNKGHYGHVFVIGGSLGKPGAAAMAGMAALRAGAGLSTVATPKSVLPTVAGFHPELMTEPLPETDEGTISARAEEKIVALLKGGAPIKSIAMGPGVSRSLETAALMRSLVTKLKAFHYPLVIDADGLNAFEGHAEELNGHGRSLVITPHPGEMARLVGCTTADVQKDRLGVARKFAREHELILVLKGHRTLVTTGGDVWVNVTGNPGMATGGTGDILTGMVAGMMAQFPGAVLFAVLAAVYLHGLAGDVMCEQVGEHSLVATDLLRGLPEAIRQAQSEAKQKFVRWHG